MRVEPDTLNEVIPKYLEDGWQVVCVPTTRSFISSDSGPTCAQCVHAIGDRTNGAVLDALEVALEHADVPAIRPRIEHAQLMNHEDIPRLGKTGGRSDRFLVRKQRLTMEVQRLQVSNPSTCEAHHTPLGPPRDTDLLVGSATCGTPSTVW